MMGAKRRAGVVDDGQVTDEPIPPRRRMAPDGRPIGGRKLRNSVPALIAFLGPFAVAGVAIGGAESTRLPDGSHLGWPDWIVATVVTAIAFVVGWGYARCWMRFDESTVTIRNPLHRHVLPFDEIERFTIEPRFPHPFWCVCRCRDDRAIVCVAINNGDPPTRELVANFNAIVHGDPHNGTSDAKPSVGQAEPPFRPPAEGRSTLSE